MMDGFRIHDMAEYYRVTIRKLPADVSLERQTTCPACRTTLQPLVALVAQKGAQILKVGGCSVCGYFGYMDRPNAQWISDFYTRAWDTHTAHSADWVRRQQSLLSEHKPWRRIAATIAKELPLDLNRPALEIGCGYGNVLQYFREVVGFGSVVGVEHSPHRAAAVAAGLGIPVAIGPFESEKVQTEIVSYGPFSLIFSNHVFEHVVDGDAFIAKASASQRQGDWFILALPDNAGEHAGYIALYPPHLHSYSKRAIETMLNRHGYQMRYDRSPSPDNMVIVAQKVESPVPTLSFVGSMQSQIDFMRKGLGLEKLCNQGPMMLQWLVPGTGYNEAMVQPIRPDRWLLKKLLWRVKALLGRHTAAHTMLISPLTKRYTDAPIELQWHGAMTLLFK